MLKRINFICALTISLYGMTYAQTLSIGPAGGANFTTISDIPTSKTLVGVSLGAFANYSINEHLGINGKVMFDQMGTGFENTDAIVRLNYLRVPVSVVYFFGNIGNKIRPKLFAGPYASFLINAKDTNGNDIVLPNGNDVYRSTDFGGLIGAGFNYTLAERTWLNIDASYSSSFYSVVDQTNTTNKNTGFQITAGVSFPIGQ